MPAAEVGGDAGDLGVERHHPGGDLRQHPVDVVTPVGGTSLGGADGQLGVCRRGDHQLVAAAQGVVGRGASGGVLRALGVEDAEQDVAAQDADRLGHGAGCTPTTPAKSASR